MKRVLLGIPQYNVPSHREDHPMGLIFLGSVLKNKGHKVLIYDPRICRKPFAYFMQAFRPHYVGLSVMTDLRKNAFQICKEVKAFDNGIKIILGGSHFTPLSARHALEVYGDYIDFCVLGYGEKALSRIVDGEDSKTIPNLVFREQGEIVETNSEKVVRSEEIIMPDYSLVNLKKYRLRVQYEQSLPLFTSRGCPHSCIFCSAGTFSRNVAFAPAEMVMETIDQIYSLGYRAIFIQDDTFGLHKKNSYAILEYLSKKGIKYSVKSRLEILKDDFMFALKETGCYGIKFGLESIVPHVLENINKCLPLDRLENVLQIGQRLGLKIGVYLLIGNPGESYEDAMATIRYAGSLFERGIEPFAAIGCYIFPGTRLEKISKEEGVINKNFSWANEFCEVRNSLIGYDPVVPIYISKDIGYQELLSLRSEFAKYTQKQIAWGIMRLLPNVVVNPLRSLYHRWFKSDF